MKPIKPNTCTILWPAVLAAKRYLAPPVRPIDNVLKPVPQPPLEPELDLNKASGTKLFWGRPCHVDAQHGPKQEAGVQGGGTAPLVGSGAKPQKPAMICTYYNQLYNGKCYSCTQLSTLHFVINLLEPACDMLARGWPRAGTRN